MSERMSKRISFIVLTNERWVREKFSTNEELHNPTPIPRISFSTSFYLDIPRDMYPFSVFGSGDGRYKVVIIWSFNQPWPLCKIIVCCDDLNTRLDCHITTFRMASAAVGLALKDQRSSIISLSRRCSAFPFIIFSSIQMEFLVLIS